MRRLRLPLLRALVVLVAVPVHGATVKILDMNVYSYNPQGDARHEALLRIVTAIDPDIILFQEANNPSGRSNFLAQFASRYSYNFLGAPTSDNPRNHIISAYPLENTVEIYTADPSGGLFERPTIRADVDIFPLVPGTELRVYSAHHKSGTASRDNILRLNQATDDAADIAALMVSNPHARIVYAGDLNSEVGQAPLNKLLEPQTTLIRLAIVDPNNGSAVTRPASGKVIDHVLYSAPLAGAVFSPFIFNTRTYNPPSLIPAPGLATDSASSDANDPLSASDHLTLVFTVEIPEVSPTEPVRLNEVFANQVGSDYNEFIELVGPPGASLSGLSVIILEGDSDSALGRVDALWNLNGQTIPPNGLFVLGNPAVVRRDYTLGTPPSAVDQIENGSQTVLLVRNVTVSVGDDIDDDNDGVADDGVGLIEDSVGFSDNGATDKIYYGAATVAPQSGSVLPGAARVPDSVGTWVLLSATLDGSDGKKAGSPGLSNLPGDFDRDGNVDGADFDFLHETFTGPNIPGTNLRADLDDDGDVDQEDFGILQARLGA